jgi:nicotinate dehydrogenase subunit A
MAERITLNVNGETHSMTVDPDMPLLYALRDEIGLRNPKFGCGLAQCGACTVHVNGEATRSCVTPVSAVAASDKVVTLEGLGTPEKPHPVQKAFEEEQVAQCGYCINGWVMTSAALLKQNPKMTDAQIREGLAGLKCRCGTHMGIIRAVKRAGTMMG